MLVQIKAFIPRINFECDKHKQPSVKGVLNWRIFPINYCIFSKLKDFLPKLKDFSSKLKIKETPLSRIAKIGEKTSLTYYDLTCFSGEAANRNRLGKVGSSKKSNGSTGSGSGTSEGSASSPSDDEHGM